MDKKIIGILLVVIAAILWGFNTIILKLIYLENVDPLTITSLRLLLSGVILFVFVNLFKKKRREFYSVDKISKKYLILLGTLFTISAISWMYALTLTSIANVLIIGNMAAVFTLIISRLWLKEKITPNKITALLFTFMGIVIITTPAYDINLFSNQTFWGDFIALFHSLIWGTFYVVSRKLGKKLEAVITNTWSFVVSAILLLPFSIYALLKINISLKAWLLILLTVLAANIFGNIAIHAANRRMEASIVSVMILLEIPIGGFFAYFIFNEIPGWYTYLGGLLIIIGVIIISFSKTKKAAHA